MRMKTLLAAAAIAAFSGSAFAQTTGATGANQGGSLAGAEQHWSTETESRLYSEHEDVMRGFFIDDAWTALVTEEEFTTTWSALAVEDQDQIRAACDELELNPGAEYQQVTVDLCTRVGAI